MEKQKNKPKERIEVGRISLLKWENFNGAGEVFVTFSLSKTLTRRSQDDPSKFEGQIFNLNGLTRNDLEAIKQAIAEMEGTIEVLGE